MNYSVDKQQKWKRYNPCLPRLVGLFLLTCDVAISIAVDVIFINGIFNSTFRICCTSLPNNMESPIRTLWFFQANY